MKLGNIVLAGAALTVALASCSQKEEGVAVSGNPKAVTVSFANVTRSAGDKVDKDKTALYEDFYVLFTDDAGKIYKGKSADLTTDALFRQCGRSGRYDFPPARQQREKGVCNRQPDR